MWRPERPCRTKKKIVLKYAKEKRDVWKERAKLKEDFNRGTDAKKGTLGQKST